LIYLTFTRQYVIAPLDILKSIHAGKVAICPVRTYLYKHTLSETLNRRFGAMIKKTGFFLILIGITAMVLFNGNGKEANAQNFPDRSGIPARLAADYIHSVIEAGRKVYSDHIVDRLGKKIELKATEDWEKKNTLLLPAQFSKRKIRIGTGGQKSQGTFHLGRANPWNLVFSGDLPGYCG
jgi:hypothetical protein